MSRFALLITIVLAACSDKLPDFKFEFHRDNTTLPKITFTTRDSATTWVEYYCADLTQPVFQTRPSDGVYHQIILLNIKPAREYRYRVQIRNRKNKTITSPWMTFRSKSVPDTLLTVEKMKIDTSVFQGYILIRRFFQSGVDALIDAEGDIVWYHSYGMPVRRAFSWTADNTILSIVDSARIQEIDLYGNILLDIDLEKNGLPYKVHHEIFRDKKSRHLVAISHDSRRFNLKRHGGSSNQPLMGDGILELSEKGQVINYWSVFDELNPEKFVGFINLQENWGHANAVWADDSDHFYISFRDFNQIWKIDRKTGKVVWKLGMGGDFVLKNPDDYFIRQHSVSLHPDYGVEMFDNGDHSKRPNSRVLAFRINESERQAVTSTKVVLPLSLSSYRMCSVYPIAKNKHLVCTTKKDGIINVMDDTGKILWQVRANHASYRAYFIPNPFSGLISTRAR